MKILLVEDEDPKRDHIVGFFEQRGSKYELILARSVRSAVDKIKSDYFDLIILDMSLPTFDIGPNESGGRPQGFGGIEIMRYMDRLTICTPVVVVTAYEVFSENGQDIDLTSLANQLMADYSAFFKGLIYYNSITGSWATELANIIGTF